MSWLTLKQILCVSAHPAATNTCCKRRSPVCILLLQLSNLYLQPAELIVRAAPARCSSSYWCVYLRNGNELSMEVSSITPGVCGVNMLQPGADAQRDCLELRWERLALLIRAHGAADRWSSSLWPLSELHGGADTAHILKAGLQRHVCWQRSLHVISTPLYIHPQFHVVVCRLQVQPQSCFRQDSHSRTWI